MVLLALTSLRLARAPAGAPNYVTASGTPGPPQRERERSATTGDMDGDAPWALSALPECFRQLSSASGTRAFVRGKMPPGVRIVPNGTMIVSADCTLAVRGDEVRVVRGADRLRVPPVARLYAVPGGRLVLYRRSGTREELRVYARAGAF